MDQIQNYKCPCCGDALVFSGAKQMLHCASCGNDYEPETIKLATEADATAQSQSKYDWEDYIPRYFAMEEDTLKEYECPSCGAKITSDGSLSATVCPYCGNTTILNDKFEGSYMPDYVIPFRIEKNEAVNRFLENAKKKRFIPGPFKSESKVKEVVGVYVPFWMFDCDAEADITYTAQMVTGWSDSKYNYTKTDYFKLYRSGRTQFENIPVDASLKAEDEYMDAIEPFDYSCAVKFDKSYLSGYFADKYDVSVEDSIDRANRRIRSSLESMLSRDTAGYSSVQAQDARVHVNDGKIRYALLPVWMLNVSYKGNTYKFAMNGQTGKSIGNYPVSKAKVNILSAAVFVATAAISMGIYALIKNWGLF